MLPTSRDFFAGFYGILLAGGIPVPIYPPARLSQLEEHLRRQRQILSNAESVMLLTVPEQLIRRKLPELLDQLGLHRIEEHLEQRVDRVDDRPSELLHVEVDEIPALSVRNSRIARI